MITTTNMLALTVLVACVTVLALTVLIIALTKVKINFKKGKDNVNNMYKARRRKQKALQKYKTIC